MKTRYVLYVLIGAILVFIPYIPHVYWHVNSPPGQVYSWLHQYPLDYYLYLSSINQGKNGEWLLYPAFTTENLRSGLFYIYFILLGKVAALFNLWLPIAYHVGKLSSAFLYLILLYKLAGKILGKQIGIWAAVLSLVWTLPPESYMGTQIWFPFPPWWFSYHPIERMDGLPHHFFGQTLLLGSAYMFLKYLDSGNIKHIIVSFMLIWIHSIAFPPTVVFYLAAVPLAYGLYLMRKYFGSKKILFEKNYLLAVVGAGVIAGICIVIIKWQETFGFPWNQWTPWELGRWNRGEPEFNTTLLKLFGILPAALIMIFFLGWKKIKFSYLLLFAWGILPYLFLSFADILSVPKIRLVQLLPIVPMTFAFVAVLWALVGHLKNGKVFAGIMLLVLSIQGILGFLQYKEKWNYMFSEGRYLGVNILNAMSYLDTRAPRKTHILSYEYDGILIPVLSQAIPYWAQYNQTYEFFRKKEEVIGFLTYRIDANQAEAFLKHHDIRFIYYGPHEKNLGGPTLRYPFLKEVYKNPDVIIYSVGDI